MSQTGPELTTATQHASCRTRRATELVKQIQTRLHEGHHRALLELLAMAAAEANGIDADLVDGLRTIGNELEQHIFKNERASLGQLGHSQLDCAGSGPVHRANRWLTPPPD